MAKSLSKILSAALFLILSGVGSAQAIGDDPYWPGYGYEPGISSGCWKWNWQQHSWYDHCPAYEHPKAFIYSRGALRARG